MHPLARFTPTIEWEPRVQSSVISPPSTIYADLEPTWIPEILSLNCSENWSINPQTVAASETEDLQAKTTRREERLELGGTTICGGAHASVQGLGMRRKVNPTEREATLTGGGLTGLIQLYPRPPSRTMTNLTVCEPGCFGCCL